MRRQLIALGSLPFATKRCDATTDFARCETGDALLSRLPAVNGDLIQPGAVSTRQHGTCVRPAPETRFSPSGLYAKCNLAGFLVAIREQRAFATALGATF